MYNKFGQFIYGKWQPSEKNETYEVINPATEEVIGKAQKAGKDVKKLPLSLGEALDRLKEDKVSQSAMRDEMYKVFHWYKNDEWEKFLGATTQWDLDTYLDCLP